MTTLIRVEDLFVHFNGNRVLNGLDMEVREGEIYVILGPSGVGKSVLLKNLIGLLRPNSGRIFLGDAEVSAMKERELNILRENVGMVFQGSALLNSLTVLDNVALPLRERHKLSEEEIVKRCKEKLALVDLQGSDDLLPSQLSGGMKKRVSIARVLAIQPKLILYDEPTVGLDPILADDVDKLILQLKRTLGVTSLVVTHDLDSAFMLGDRIAMLHEGKFHFVGTPQEFQSTDNPIVKRFTQRGKK